MEDLYQEARLAAVICYEKWVPSKSQFITFAYMCVDQRMLAILDYATRACRNGQMVELEKVEQRQMREYRGQQDSVLIDPVLALLATQV